MNQQKDRVALVTGTASAQGLGRAFVKALAAKQFHKIYAWDCVQSDLSAIQGNTSIETAVVDITDAGALSRAAKGVKDVDLVISNAGVCYPSQLIGSQNLENARREMEVNFWGALMLCRALVPALTDNASLERRSAIVIVSSIYGFVNQPFVGSYSVSKAASASMVQGIRAELADRLVDVIGVYPGTLDTEMSRSNPTTTKTKPGDLADFVIGKLDEGSSDLFYGPDSAGLIEKLRSDRQKSVESDFARQYRARITGAQKAR
jgi:NAD(P)-dependent dehydrogenase (short-subunit alcohol dehydrogenase family)